MKKIALALTIIVFVLVPLASAEQKPGPSTDPWKPVSDGQKGMGDLYKNKPGYTEPAGQTDMVGQEDHGDQQAQDGSISRSEENKVDRRRSPWRKLPPYFPPRRR